jgi:DNA repair protein RadC
VLAADATSLDQIVPGESDGVRVIEAARAMMLHSLRAELLRGPVLEKGQALIDYLMAGLAQQPREVLRALYLDARMRLIRDEVVGIGSIAEAPAYPREILRRAFEVGAAALILVHNHTSGDPMPSGQDVALTRKLMALGAALDVRVQDHIIVARSGWTSLRALGLMETAA